jgi:hypothetical protein
MKRAAFLKMFGSGALAGTILVGHPRQLSGAAPQWTEAQIQSLLEEISSMSRILFELAGERFAANAMRGEVWILTAHSGTEVMTIADAKCVLLALPTAFAKDAPAVKRYVSLYNSFNLSAADQLVLEGKLEPAERTFRLVLKYDTQDHNRQVAKDRINLIKDMKADVNVEQARQKIRETHSNVASIFDFSKADRKHAKVVKDLLDVELK